MPADVCFAYREVAWSNSSFEINHQPFYFRGFGRHEDSNIRGKGLDLPLMVRYRPEEGGCAAPHF